MRTARPTSAIFPEKPKDSPKTKIKMLREELKIHKLALKEAKAIITKTNKNIKVLENTIIDLDHQLEIAKLT